MSGDLQAYTDVRVRLDQLLRGRDGDEAVPTCPAWTVRDVVAHLTGLCEDWVDGRLDRYASDEWTAAQVERGAGASLDDLLDRWGGALDRFAALPADPTMGPPARWAFGDAVVHEADIRGALGAERVPQEAVGLSLKGQVARWRQVLGDGDTPTLLLRCPDLRDWWLGQPDDPDATVVEAAAYDVFRALAGRRSAEQVGSWHWSADPSPFIDAGLPYPFSFAPEPVVD